MTRDVSIAAAAAAAAVKCVDQRYLLEVEIILRLQQMKLLLLVSGRAHQQIVKHVVVPAGQRSHKFHFSSVIYSTESCKCG